MQQEVLKAMRRLALFLFVVAGAVCLAGDEAKPGMSWKPAEALMVEGRGWSDGLKSCFDRLPAKAEGKVTPAVWGLSHNSSGICVRFVTDAKTVSLNWTLTSGGLAMPHMPATGVSGLDVYRRDATAWTWVCNMKSTQFPANTASFAGAGAPTEYLLYLPLYNGVSKLELGVPAGSRLEAAPPRSEAKRLPLVFYGTSITQGACASRPGMSYTAIVGRRLDLPVVNLGFSGSGKMELEMAGLLAEIDARLYVLDCLWNMDGKQIQERVEPFIKALRAKRPDTPILMLEDSNVHDACPTGKGKLLRGIVEKLSAEGVKGLSVVAGKGLLGADCEGTVDGCHPNDLGFMRHAEVLAPVIKELVPTSGF